MNTVRLPVYVLLAVFIWTVGCGRTTRKDPLTGWKCLASALYPDEKLPPLPKAITDDYENYISKLPLRKDLANHREGYWIDFISVFEDGDGNRAVVIEIALDGIHWKHVLIYDRENKRTKTIKWDSGHYMS